MSAAGVWGFGTSNRNNFFKDQTPIGPGQYEYLSQIGAGPKYTLVGRKDQVKGRKDYPGPGTYQYKVDSYRTRDPA